MSKREIPIRFTPKQKELVQKLLGRAADEVSVPQNIAGMMLYAVITPSKAKTNIIPLTDEQKKLLKTEFKVTCDYIEVTKESNFK